MAKVQDLIQQLNALSDSFQADPTSLDRDSRIQLQQAAYRAARSLEDGYDMSRRVLTESPTEQLAVRIGCDLNIFSLLEAEQPQTPEKLNEKLNIEPTILARVLQTLSGFGALKQTSQGYSLAHGSSTVAKPDFAQCFGTCQDWLLPIYQALPKKLKAEEYKLPQTDATDLAVQYAWGDKGKGLFEILGGRPAIAGGFRQLMSTWGTSGSFLYDYYPVEERLIKGYDSSISDVMFVDLGGNWGNKVIAVKDRFPHMPGRLIVQDLPYSIESAPKTDKAELTVHDFFQPQPVKRMYSDISCSVYASIARLTHAAYRSSRLPYSPDSARFLR